MEQISFRLHARSVSTWRKLTSPRSRRALEYVLLLFALTCFGTIFCLHALYSSDMFDFGMIAQNCLNLELENQGINVTNLIQMNYQHDYFPIIRIHISDESMLSENTLLFKEQLYDHFEMWRSEKDFVGDDALFSPSSSVLSQSIPQRQFSYWDLIMHKTGWKETSFEKNSTVCLGKGVCSFMEGTDLEEFLSKQKVYLFSLKGG